ncbi:MAG TPA: sigma-70 family RNA polymerase sigma factor [Solirubrobacteraceae bacterium]|jgi:RNA polymerase sigma-70 factor (TIGR02960 family)
MRSVIDELETRNRLARAQRGDEEAFAQLTAPYRRELQLHCYRILGSLQDAEDLLQETLLAAWRGLEQFEGRSSLRAWLYTIATNRCLNALRDRGRRPQPVAGAESGQHPAGSVAEIAWLEPYPDSLFEAVADVAPGPDARYEAKESIALAFVSGLQHLAPRQRAVLVLRDVLGFHADEVAEMLGSSPASVNSALQRARASLESRVPAARDRLAMPLTVADRELVGRFADALQRDDIDEVVAMLTDDAVISMPPEPEWHTGREAIEAFLRARKAARGGPWRFVATSANGQPAFAYYLTDAEGWARSGLLVVGVRADGITSVTRFHEGLLDRFDLPERL